MAVGLQDNWLRRHAARSRVRHVRSIALISILGGFRSCMAGGTAASETTILAVRRLLRADSEQVLFPLLPEPIARLYRVGS